MTPVTVPADGFIPTNPSPPTRDEIPMSELVYHFTDTARLPWIIDSGELRPGRNQVFGLPDPDFLWATTNERGDRTAAAMTGYRTGLTALVRLTLHAEDFELWPDITRRFPQWTNDHIHRLEQTARGSNPAQWRGRVTPLSCSRIRAAEAKTYTSSWRPIKLHVLRNETALGVEFGGSVYFSVQHIKPGQPTTYVASAAMRSGDQP